MRRVVGGSDGATRGNWMNPAKIRRRSDVVIIAEIATVLRGFASMARSIRVVDQGLRVGSRFEGGREERSGQRRKC